MPTVPSDVRAQQQRFLLEHLRECAADVLHWRRAGVLPTAARLRELGKLCVQSDDDGLSDAERLVVHEALLLAALTDTSPGTGKKAG